MPANKYDEKSCSLWGHAINWYEGLLILLDPDMLQKGPPEWGHKS